MFFSERRGGDECTHNLLFVDANNLSQAFQSLKPH